MKIIEKYEIETLETITIDEKRLKIAKDIIQNISYYSTTF
jgi:hypothetical protein